MHTSNNSTILGFSSWSDLTALSEEDGIHPHVCVARLTRQLTPTEFLILHMHFYHTCGKASGMMELSHSHRRVAQATPYCFETTRKRYVSSLWSSPASSRRLVVLPVTNDFFLKSAWLSDLLEAFFSRTQLLFCKKMACWYRSSPCSSCIFPFQNKSVVGW